MFKLKNNKTVVTIFAVLMVLSVAAIYIPLLFPPQNQPPLTPGAETPAEGTSSLPATSTPSSTPSGGITAPATSTKNLPSSLQGLSSDENALNQIQNGLNGGSNK